YVYVLCKLPCYKGLTVHFWYVYRGDPSIVKLNIAITTGYLISDLLLIICYWKAIGDKFFVIHHLAALYAYYFVLSKGLLAYFGNFRLLAEFSTPFVNQRICIIYIEENTGSVSPNMPDPYQPSVSVGRYPAS
uniref:TLC domain-containing protein n=1 Tax=Pavo cristatus TaxID=9049 RepID=A0A8C9FV17_PAVCR